MVDWYVRSSTGDDDNSGADWSHAKASLTNLLGAEDSPWVAPGDRVFVDSNNYEQWWQGLGWDGTIIGPEYDYGTTRGWDGWEDGYVLIYSVDSTGDPEPPSIPGDLLAGATVRNNSQCYLWCRGPVYCYGVTFQCERSIIFHPDLVQKPTAASEWYEFPGAIWDTCKFELLSGYYEPHEIELGTPSNFTLDDPYIAQFQYRFINCIFDIDAINAGVIRIWGQANVIWENCTLQTSSYQSTDPIILSGPANLEMYGCDLSDCPSSKFLVGYRPLQESAWKRDYFPTGEAHCLIERCKLPSSFAGCFRGSSTTYPATGDDFIRGEMYFSQNSGQIDTRIFEYCSLRGKAEGETTYVRSGGANNGVGSYSVKVSTPSTGNAVPGTWFPFCLKPIRFYCYELGTKIFSFEILHDSATNLKDKDVWVEVLHIGSALPGLTGRSLPHTLNLLSGTDLPAGVGTGSWTTTSMSNPNSQKVSITVDIDHEQIIEFQLKVGISNKILYIDPKVEVST